MNKQNRKTNRIQGVDIFRLMRKYNLEQKWLTIYAACFLPYWQLANYKHMVLIVPLTGSRSSPIYHQICICFYHIKSYPILKERLQRSP